MSGVKIKGSPYIYLGKAEERSKITFILSILERKVPHTKN
jgi:malate synthase